MKSPSSVVFHNLLFTFTQLERMSPSLTNEPTIVPESEDDVQFQKWLKELDNAEELMDDLEAKTEKLDAKMDALLNSLNEMNNSKKETPTVEANMETTSNAKDEGNEQ